LKTIRKTRFWAGAGWQKRKQILRFSENLQKPLVKQCFEQEHQMAGKKTDPWSPAAHHGIARNTIKKPWGNKVSAHGRTGNKVLGRSGVAEKKTNLTV